MDRLSVYFEIVPLPLLLAAGVLGLFAFLVIPRRYRLSALLAVGPVWLTSGQFVAMGPIQAVAKATGFVFFAGLALSAMLHPGPRVKLPWITTIYPATAVIMLLLAVPSGVIVGIEGVLRLQWVMLTIAGLLVARTITDLEQLRNVIGSVAFGMGVTLLIAGSSFVLAPGASVAPGLGRFTPWGANPNQVGTLFIMGVTLLVYFGVDGRSGYVRFVSLGLAAYGSLLSLLTASRSVVFVIAVLTLPAVWTLRKKPAMMALGICAAIVALVLGWSSLSDANIERVGSLESGRFEIWPAYANAIVGNPVIGAALRSSMDGRPVDTHAHNAYLELMYMYGLPISGLVIAVGAAACFAAIKIWLAWRKDPFYRLTASQFAMLTLGFYAHAVTTIVLYYPTYVWSFLAVVMSCTMLAFKNQLQESTPLWSEDAAEWYEQEPQDEYYDTRAGDVPAPA